MKAAIVLGTIAATALAAPVEPIVEPRQSTSDQLVEALGPLGDFVGEINDCIPADVGVGALDPKGSIASLNLDIDPEDARLEDILSCIKSAVPVPVKSHEKHKRTAGLDIDLGEALKERGLDIDLGEALKERGLDIDLGEALKRGLDIDLGEALKERGLDIDLGEAL